MIDPQVDEHMVANLLWKIQCAIPHSAAAHHRSSHDGDRCYACRQATVEILTPIMVAESLRVLSALLDIYIGETGDLRTRAWIADYLSEMEEQARVRAKTMCDIDLDEHNF